MTNRTPLYIVGFLAVYALFLVGIYFGLQQNVLGSTGSEDVGDFMAVFQRNALTVLGVSFACMLAWFALGEWVISATSPAGTWTLTWVALLIVTVAAAVYMAFSGPHGGSTDPVNYTVASYYLGIGVLSFYISTLLFSPTNAMYRVWPAETFRRW